jgi:AcrR family transcriptional regulator
MDTNVNTGVYIVSMVDTGSRLPRAERRDQLVRCAAAVFVRGGFAGTSMDDVAREAGVTRLIVYRIFESKDVLYRAVLENVIDDMAASFDARRPDEPIAVMMLGVARRHPDGFRLLWRHAAHEPEFREVAALFKVAVTEYAIELLSGHLAGSPESPESSASPEWLWAAEAVVAHLYEGVCLWLDDGDPERDAAFVAMLSEGIRAMVARWAEVSRPLASRGRRSTS